VNGCCDSGHASIEKAFLKNHPNPWTLLLILLAVLTGCGGGIPQPAVDRVEISAFTFTHQQFRDSEYALSPDGRSLTLEDLSQINLKTGEETRPFANYTGMDWWVNSSGGPLGWSPDGRLLAITTASDNRTPGANRSPTVLLNTENQTIQQFDNISTFRYWSPFRTSRFLASLAHGGWNIFSINDQHPTAISDAIDFRRETEFGGTGDFLWSKRLDRPIAILNWIPVMGSDDTATTGKQVVLDAFSNPMDYQNLAYRLDTGYQVSPANRAIKPLLDPTGRFILILEWECKPGSPSPCLNENGMEQFNLVTDSRVIVVNWQTGEQKELLRLSTIDPNGVVASRDVVWSADGKIILLGRENAPAIIIHLK
jgi:hypothetical protein